MKTKLFLLVALVNAVNLYSDIIKQDFSVVDYELYLFRGLNCEQLLNIVYQPDALNAVCSFGLPLEMTFERDELQTKVSLSFSLFSLQFDSNQAIDLLEEAERQFAEQNQL